MKRYICIVMAALLLAGCTGPTATQTTTKATTPEKTPMEMIGQTVQTTLNASSLTLEYAQGDADGVFATQFSVALSRDTRGGYLAVMEKPCGCGEYIHGKTAVIRDCESGAAEQRVQEEYYGVAYLLRLLPQLEEQVLQRFCNTGLTASPSRDGSMRFEINGLDAAQMEQLLGMKTDAGEDFQGYFVMMLDAYGNLTQVEYTHGAVIHRIRISNINQKLNIEKPEWA